MRTEAARVAKPEGLMAAFAFAYLTVAGVMFPTVGRRADTRRVRDHHPRRERPRRGAVTLAVLRRPGLSNCPLSPPAEGSPPSAAGRAPSGRVVRRRFFSSRRYGPLR